MWSYVPAEARPPFDRHGTMEHEIVTHRVGQASIVRIPELALDAADPGTLYPDSDPAAVAEAARDLGPGSLDPRTGLLTTEAFHRELATAIYHTKSHGGTLSVARFMLGQKQERPLLDAGRILSRLMRRVDFGALENDGSILVAFTDTDLRNAHTIARRLSSVMKHTAHSTKRELRIDPRVVVAASLPDDSAKSLLARLNDEARRVAS